MKVILKQDYAKLGKAGDVVNVKDGYATNFLIPNNFAVKASESNVIALEEIKRQQSKKILKMTQDAEKIAEELFKTEIVITKLAGEEGKLYGSVTAQDLSDALMAKGFNIDKKHIGLHDHIKELGDFTVDVKLYNNIKASLKVKVEKQEA
jgi:large subunit ribosomal protein L9